MNTEQPPVSVLVPVYFVQRYIAECAESLFAQTYTNLRYIFVDDYSSDYSIDVLKKVLGNYPERQPYVRIISHEENQGLGGARYTAYESVKTEYFTIVDSDDVLPLNAIEVLMKRMEETDADIVEGAFREYDKGQLGKCTLPFHGSQKAYQRKLLCQNVIKNNVWGKLYKTEATRRVNFLFEQGIDYAEDYSATTRLSFVARRAWTDEVVYYYRTDNIRSYTSRMTREKVISCLKAGRRVLLFCLMKGHLSMASDIGALNLYRLCHNNGVSMEEADSILKYVPEHLMSDIIYHLFRINGVGYWVGDKMYRVLRLLVK